MIRTKRSSTKKCGVRENHGNNHGNHQDSKGTVAVESLSRAFSGKLSLKTNKKGGGDDMSMKRGLAVGSNTPLTKCSKGDSSKATEKRQKVANTPPALVTIPSGEEEAKDKIKALKALEERVLNECFFTGHNKTETWEHPLKEEGARKILASEIVGCVEYFHEHKAIDKYKLQWLNPSLKHVLKDKKFGSTINQMAYGIAAWATYQYIAGELAVYPKKNDVKRLCDMMKSQRDAAEKFIAEYMAPLDNELAGGENALETYTAEVMKWNIFNMRENLRKKISRYGVWAPREMLTESDTNGVYVYHFLSVAKFDHTLFDVRERHKERNQTPLLKDKAESAEDAST